MNEKIAILVAFILASASSSGTTGSSSNQRDFIIKAGVMEHAITTKDRLRETQELTLDPARRPGWCFIVDPPSTDPYQVYSVHHLPGDPRSLTGDFRDAKPDLAGAGIKTAVKRVDGIRPFCFDFHDGDPLGEYLVEVFINGALKTTLRLHVVPPPAHAIRGGDE